MAPLVLEFDLDEGSPALRIMVGATDIAGYLVAGYQPFSVDGDLLLAKGEVPWKRGIPMGAVLAKSEGVEELTTSAWPVECGTMLHGGTNHLGSTEIEVPARVDGTAVKGTKLTVQSILGTTTAAACYVLSAPDGTVLWEGTDSLFTVKGDLAPGKYELRIAVNGVGARATFLASTSLVTA
jgi:hypothetical protein